MLAFSRQASKPGARTGELVSFALYPRRVGANNADDIIMSAYSRQITRPGAWTSELVRFILYPRRGAANNSNGNLQFKRRQLALLLMGFLLM